VEPVTRMRFNCLESMLLPIHRLAKGVTIASEAGVGGVDVMRPAFVRL